MRPLFVFLFAPALWGATILPAVIPNHTDILIIGPEQAFLSFSISQAEIDSQAQTDAFFTAALYYTESVHINGFVFDASLRPQMERRVPSGVLFSNGDHAGMTMEAILPRSPASYTLSLQDGSASYITTLRTFTDPPGLPAVVPEPAAWLLLACGIAAFALKRARMLPFLLVMSGRAAAYDPAQRHPYGPSPET